jgi:hypothetical protein
MAYQPPRILSRADCLLRPPTSRTPRDPSLLVGLVVHHEAARPPLGSDPAELWAGIQRFHQQSNGWADIAYNAGVWHDGTICLGRDTGVVGAHTVSPAPAPNGFVWNVSTLGICLIGDGSDPAYCTDEAWSSILWYWALNAYVTNGRASGLWTHRETGSPTQCASYEVQRRMDSLRTWFAAGTPEVP